MLVSFTAPEVLVMPVSYLKYGFESVGGDGVAGGVGCGVGFTTITVGNGKGRAAGRMVGDALVDAEAGAGASPAMEGIVDEREVVVADVEGVDVGVDVDSDREIAVEGDNGEVESTRATFPGSATLSGTRESTSLKSRLIRRASVGAPCLRGRGAETR